MILSREFFIRPPQNVARDLLGKQLIRILEGQRVGGIITDVEAYGGEQDLASHARSGMTQRNKAMYGTAGFAYIYFTYGMHWMFNCVTGEPGCPSAVLIRAIKPVEGLDIIHSKRPNIQKSQFCNGPAKLTKALAITGQFNGSDLCRQDSDLFIEDCGLIADDNFQSTPRIGIQSTPEPWLSIPWRFVTNL